MNKQEVHVLKSEIRLLVKELNRTLGNTKNGEALLELRNVLEQQNSILRDLHIELLSKELETLRAK